MPSFCPGGLGGHVLSISVRRKHVWAFGPASLFELRRMGSHILRRSFDLAGLSTQSCDLSAEASAKAEARPCERSRTAPSHHTSPGLSHSSPHEESLGEGGRSKSEARSREIFFPAQAAKSATMPENACSSASPKSADRPLRLCWRRRCLSARLFWPACGCLDERQMPEMSKIPKPARRPSSDQPMHLRHCL